MKLDETSRWMEFATVTLGAMLAEAYLHLIAMWSLYLPGGCEIVIVPPW